MSQVEPAALVSQKAPITEGKRGKDLKYSGSNESVHLSHLSLRKQLLYGGIIHFHGI